MSILIENVLMDGKRHSILIEGNRISAIDSGESADVTIDGSRKAAIPGLVNTHTHAAMTLFRGYADDMLLQDWLSTKIWPLEQKLTSEHIYWGTKLACLEMIRSGTTCFSDMYFFMENTARAVDEMGIRGVLSEGFIDLMNPDTAREQFKSSVSLVKAIRSMQNERVVPSIGPHSIYTVSEESLKMIADFARQENLLIHIHLSETREEVESCIERHGKRPAQYLDDIGFLGPNVLAAHSVWLDKEEIGILKSHDVKVSHNPVSNMKLAVGRAIPYSEMRSAGVLVSLGTDGCASNNTLDMFEAMKFAALYQKAHTGDATVLPAQEALGMATINGARAIGIDAGELSPGKLADIVLIDLDMPQLQPGHNMVSDLVYAANGNCVDTVMCDGKILMRDKQIEGEEDILEKAREAAFDLVCSR